MKTIMTLALSLLIATATFAQKKVGIINFSFNGKDRMSSMSDAPGSEQLELYFIGDNTTKISDTLRTSDAIVLLTQTMLKEYVGSDLIPVKLDRPSTVPDQINGSLWLMEAITEKAALQKLNYDEVIVVNARIYSGSKSNKGYKPVVEISLKITGKDGKTRFKKTEKLKPEGAVIEPKLVEYKENNSNVTITDIYKSVKGSKEKESNMAAQGITGVQLLDWYQQCLTNLLITD